MAPGCATVFDIRGPAASRHWAWYPHRLHRPGAGGIGGPCAGPGTTGRTPAQDAGQRRSGNHPASRVSSPGIPVLQDREDVNPSPTWATVNVKSQLVSVRAALPELRRAGGSVVLTVSTSGFYPGRGGVLYVASKFAVRGCVIALAHELAPEVRVNGVAPGGTLGTELTGPRSLGLADSVLGAAPGREQDLRRRTPLQVALTGEDHAGSYVFLASDRARGITGTVVHSDGGVGVK